MAKRKKKLDLEGKIDLLDHVRGSESFVEAMNSLVGQEYLGR